MADLELHRTDSEVEALAREFMRRWDNPEDVDRAKEGLGRERSFDYCFNYFQRTENPTQQMEMSCAVLGYYLASWGMLRGSSFLFRETNLRRYWRVIETIEARNQDLRGLSPADYLEETHREQVLSTYREIGSALVPPGTRFIVLSTKVMVGVWGAVPAFDSYFVAGFRRLVPGRIGACMEGVNAKSLGYIAEFYLHYRNIIDRLSAEWTTRDFETNELTDRHYPPAKVVDMIGFTLGWQSA